MNPISFLIYNSQKRLTVYAYIYSAIYRLELFFIKPKYLQKHWGIEGKESPEEEAPWKYRYAMNVSRVVNRICSKTAWESKCLVRALTAQKILKKKGIHSTLYLGCGMEAEKIRLILSMRSLRLFKTVHISQISTDSIMAMMMIHHCFRLTSTQKKSKYQ